MLTGMTPFPTTGTGSMGLLDQVRGQLDRLTPEQAWAEHRRGALLIDVRTDTHRACAAGVPGAIAIDLTVLPWRLDPGFDHRIPEATDLDRRIIQLKIEEQALQRETDAASKDRLANLRKELADLEQQSSELTTRWQNERDKIQAGTKVKEELDAAKLELEQAQRTGDLAKAGELQYGRIPELEKRMAEAEGHSENAMLRERVTEDDIASVVSRWTGVPVERMMEGEREKLLNMEAAIGSRVIVF